MLYNCYLKNLFIFLLPFLPEGFIIIHPGIYSYDITIKIRGNGKQRIISEKSKLICPNEIYHNNDSLIGSKICEINFSSEENIITMKWNSPINGDYLFTDLTSLLEVDLSNLKLIKGPHGMLDMFNGCTSLTSINFENLNTSSVSNSAARLFRNCYSLKSIDLSKLDISNIIFFDDIFQGCSGLEYINFINYNEPKLYFQMSIGNEMPSNLIICINQTIAPKIYKTLSERPCTIIYCGENWRDKQKKIIRETKKCVDKCENDYSYEFENKCYSTYPNGTKANNFICEKDEIKFTEITQIISTERTEIILTNGLENIQNISIITNNSTIKNYFINISWSEYKNLLLSNITEFINSSVIINGSNFISVVISSDNMDPKELLKKGISAIDLGNCSSIIKEHYNISQEENLFVLNTELKNEDTSKANNSNSFNLGKSV